MASLQDLLAQRQALTECRNTGVRSVTLSDGRQTEYRSDAELAAAIAALDRQIAALRNGMAITTVRISSSKGL
jgi:hypothetical protein